MRRGIRFGLTGSEPLTRSGCLARELRRTEDPLGVGQHEQHHHDGEARGDEHPEHDLGRARPGDEARRDERADRPPAAEHARERRQRARTDALGHVAREERVPGEPEHGGREAEQEHADAERRSGGGDERDQHADHREHRGGDHGVALADACHEPSGRQVARELADHEHGRDETRECE